MHLYRFDFTVRKVVWKNEIVSFLDLPLFFLSGYFIGIQPVDVFNVHLTHAGTGISVEPGRSLIHVNDNAGNGLEQEEDSIMVLKERTETLFTLLEGFFDSFVFSDIVRDYNYTNNTLTVMQGLCGYFYPKLFSRWRVIEDLIVRYSLPM